LLKNSDNKTIRILAIRINIEGYLNILLYL